MNSDTTTISNSLGLWLACSVMVIIMLIQSAVFMKKAWNTGPQIGLTREQMVRGLRSGAITSIGPAFSVLVALVGLIATVGSAVAWLRLSVIGAIMYEGLAASNAMSAMGVTMGDGNFTPTVLACCVWVMGLGSSGWLLVTGFFTHKLEKARIKLVGGKEALLPVFTICAILGAFGYNVAKYTIKLDRSTIAAIASAGCMILLTHISKRTNKKWIGEWALGISMVVGMFVAVIGLEGGN